MLSRLASAQTAYFVAGGTECILPRIIYFGGAVDGQATARVVTFDDLNGNGVRDAGEPPLPWVTIGTYPEGLTDATGNGITGEFKPGCACRCWEHTTVTVSSPPGYRNTSPTEVAMTGEGMTYNFGFQLVDPSQQPSFSDEPDWYRAFINRGLKLALFHFETQQKLLAISIEASQTESPHGPFDETYRGIIDVISGLAEANVTVDRVQVRILKQEGMDCDLETPRRQSGMISPMVIFSRYCTYTQP